MTRRIDYPQWICNTCGQQFGKNPNGPGMATWHIGTCDICNEKTSVTEPRDFGHLYDGWQKKDGK